MTEDEWLACADPHKMIYAVGPHLSERQLRLLACAAARRVSRLLEDCPFRSALGLAEAYADSRASLEDGRTAHRNALELLESQERQRPLDARAFASAAASWACWVLTPSEWEEWTADRLEALARMPGVPAPILTYKADLIGVAVAVAHFSALAIAGDRLAWGAAVDDPDPDEERHQCGLVRCIYGNPFRPLTQIKASWLAWEAGTVLRLAHEVYDKRAYDRLPILADALEDAGCTDADILTHCRGQGQHVRGCWVLDLLLGKE